MNSFLLYLADISLGVKVASAIFGVFFVMLWACVQMRKGILSLYAVIGFICIGVAVLVPTKKCIYTVMGINELVCYVQMNSNEGKISDSALYLLNEYIKEHGD